MVSDHDPPYKAPNEPTLPGRCRMDERSVAVSAPNDLRDWIARVDAIGQLKRITSEVSRNEEMGAITYVAHQRIGEVREPERVEVAARICRHPGIDARRTEPLQQQIGQFRVLALGRDRSREVEPEHRAADQLAIDLAARGRKIVGSAQRRTRTAFVNLN